MFHFEIPAPSLIFDDDAGAGGDVPDLACSKVSNPLADLLSPIGGRFEGGVVVLGLGLLSFSGFCRSFTAEIFFPKSC